MRKDIENARNAHYHKTGQVPYIKGGSELSFIPADYATTWDEATVIKRAAHLMRRQLEVEAEKARADFFAYMDEKRAEINEEISAMTIDQAVELLDAHLFGSADTSVASEDPSGASPEGAGTSGGPDAPPAPVSAPDGTPSATDATPSGTEPGSLVVPDDWETMPWQEMRQLAGRLTTNPVVSKADAVAAIREHLETKGPV